MWGKYLECGEEREMLVTMDLSIGVCSALLGPPTAAALPWARLGSAAPGGQLVLKIQAVMALNVWGKRRVSDSCSQFSRGLCVDVEPEPSNLPSFRER